MTLIMKDLKMLLRKSWSEKTTADPQDWTPKNPAWGQCAVTALVVQDFLGAELVRGDVKMGNVLTSHYWNKLPNGKEVDLTREQLPEGTIITKSGIVKNSEKIRPRLTAAIKKRYAILRLAVENQIRPNPLFSDEKYRSCFEAAQSSQCQKTKFGCLVVCEDKVVAATCNKFIEPLKYLCKPECIRLKIQSRTESMIGACGHAEEWALQEVFRQKIDPQLCSFYIAGFDAKTNNPWIKKEAADHTCLRCAVQMYMAGIGKIWVPFVDRWTCLSAKKAVERAAAYALKEKKI